MTTTPDAREYRGYADLARAQRLGVDYRINVRRCEDSRVAIVAPHGGSIEDGTSDIALAAAGEEHNLYMLEGCRASYNYRALHLTSHRFDEPQCLALIATCTRVVTIHGCDGEDPVVMIGGLDAKLIEALARAMDAKGMAVATAGHRFPATHVDNVCNRGLTGRGAQVEVPHRLRCGASVAVIANAIRSALAQLGD